VAMSLSEFDLIERYFSRCGQARADVVLGVGDDCALLQPPPGMQLAVTTDTLVEGVHFFPDVSPNALGHKALAVNLSDLAAMGAEPAWATLALTLPEADAAWLERFSDALCRLAAEFGVRLTGGDTTRGPLSLTLHLTGFVPEEGALRRSGAQPGDRLYVTGMVGDAAMALAVRKGEIPPPETAWRRRLDERLDRPIPRVEEGISLRGIASAAIDISDGLVADLGHLLASSGGLGARVMLASIPCSSLLNDYIDETGDWRFPLAGGDDYELCFTVPPARENLVAELAQHTACGVYCIGEIEAEPGIRLLDADGRPHPVPGRGYDHFTGHG